MKPDSPSSWHILSTSNPLIARAGHTLTAVGPRCVLFGGHSIVRGRQSTYLSDTVTLDLQSMDVQELACWNTVQERGSWPKARSGHTAVPWGDEVIV